MRRLLGGMILALVTSVGTLAAADAPDSQSPQPRRLLRAVPPPRAPTDADAHDAHTSSASGFDCAGRRASATRRRRGGRHPRGAAAADGGATRQPVADCRQSVDQPASGPLRRSDEQSRPGGAQGGKPGRGVSGGRRSRSAVSHHAQSDALDRLSTDHPDPPRPLRRRRRIGRGQAAPTTTTANNTSISHSGSRSSWDIRRPTVTTSPRPRMTVCNGPCYRPS